MMGGLDTPTSGSVIVRGEELAKKNDDELTIFRRRNIGFIFQNYNLVPILNVYENIVLPVELDGDTVDKKFMDEVVYMLALEDKLENMPNNLSGDVYKRQFLRSLNLLETPTSGSVIVAGTDITKKKNAQGKKIDLDAHRRKMGMVFQPVSYTHLDVYKRQVCQ